MLESLKLKNFTVFGEATFEFANGINVIVGANGSGKTHLLKLAYACTYVLNAEVRNAGPPKQTIPYLQSAVAEKLLAVFKPDGLGRLARRSRKGRQRSEVDCLFNDQNKLEFSFSTASKTSVEVEKTSARWLEKRPVYLPTRELLTIYPGFVSLYETTHLQFDETWRDTCLLLGAPLARGPREARIKELLVPLEEAMGGKVELTDAGGFYLNVDGVRMEMHLVAEGLRKLAMIARLIATGSLIDKGYLFWDEPEANLNPQVIKTIARTILHLCQNGIQVFVATHSLFLMREMHILRQTSEFRDTPGRFFGLHPDYEGVSVEQSDSIDDIGDITSLDEELSQTDRYMQTELN